MSHIDYEPDPIYSPQGRPVTPYVMQDLRDKTRYGVVKYLRPLMTHDSRGLADAYQELIDGTSYLKKVLMEQDDLAGHVQELEPDLFDYAEYLRGLTELAFLRDNNAHLRYILKRLLEPKPDQAHREMALRALAAWNQETEDDGA